VCVRACASAGAPPYHFAGPCWDQTAKEEEKSFTRNVGQGAWGTSDAVAHIFEYFVWFFYVVIASLDRCGCDQGVGCGEDTLH
jgi:hypothetical protein